MQCIHTSQKGQTLLQIIIVVAILGTLSTFGAIQYQKLKNQIDLQTTTFKITKVLHIARDQAISSLDSSDYGVHFDADRYVIYKGATYSAVDINNEVFTLSSGLEIYDILIGGGSEVLFSQIHGTTTNSGSVNIRVINEPTIFKKINILASGQSGPEGEISPTNTRVTDSRHVHFDLGWSIQTATILTLFFTDTTNVQEDITVADFMNAGQTEFDWEASINVNGSNQILRVHTHALDGFDTTLSIHRDRRYNDKALDVSFDANDIVSYTSAGIASVGVFGGTMSEQ